MTAAEGAPGETGSPPDNPEALVEEINRTREELGNTVEALTAKVDVKARAQSKVSEVSSQLKGKVRDVTHGLSGKADHLKGEVSGRAAGVRETVSENGKTVLGAGEPVTKTIASRASQAGASAQAVATKAGCDRLGRYPGAGPAARQAGRGHREPAPGPDRGRRGRGCLAADGLAHSPQPPALSQVPLYQRDGPGLIIGSGPARALPGALS